MNAIGIDLASAPARPTACAVLSPDGALVGHNLCATDDHIVAFVETYLPALVAIDAPLSLPAGLCCLEASCSCQPLAEGSGRECERALSRLGIGCYYTTKRSIIKAMAYRAIGLRQRLGEGGSTVIEIYPYASKVRLFGRLPRKTTRAGRRALQAALCHLISGIPLRDSQLLSHDLLDALVGAYTGILYLRNAVEALGDPQEGFLYIPLAGSARAFQSRVQPST